MYIGHRKEILKLTFRALALRRNKSIRSNARYVIIVKGLCIKSRLRQSMSLNVAGSGKASLKIFEMIGLALSSHIFKFFFVFIFFFAFPDTNRETLVFGPKTSDVLTRVSGRK